MSTWVQLDAAGHPVLCVAVQPSGTGVAAGLLHAVGPEASTTPAAPMAHHALPCGKI